MKRENEEISGPLSPSVVRTQERAEDFYRRGWENLLSHPLRKDNTPEPTNHPNMANLWVSTTATLKSHRSFETATLLLRTYHQAHYCKSLLTDQIYHQNGEAKLDAFAAIDHCKMEVYELGLGEQKKKEKLKKHQLLAVYFNHLGSLHAKGVELVEAVKAFTTAIEYTKGINIPRFRRVCEFNRREALVKLGPEKGLPAVWPDQLMGTITKQSMENIIQNYDRKKGRFRKLAQEFARRYNSTFGTNLDLWNQFTSRKNPNDQRVRKPI